MSEHSAQKFRPALCKHCGHANRFGRHKCSYCSRALPVWNTPSFWVVLLIMIVMIAVVI